MVSKKPLTQFNKSSVILCLSVALSYTNFDHLKVSESQRQIRVFLIFPKTKQKIPILSIFSLENTRDSDFSYAFWENLVCKVVI